MSVSFAVAALAGRGERVPMINVRAGLITPTTRAFVAVELLLCVCVMAQEVLFP